ncbi:hypothetical protein SH601_08135 [Gracilibacillus sp. S3-1-1]|uniref:Uncharacterized protein n=1 Tax=Gracilibacillus pellucidus TaxID=3095368 RepID=A0ACC6M4Y2_9BACI|nr:hypothetical protein [Gracilibacillus sp. S3-1-1]MDX8045961.1 hypothetical protein [Gracilibacillus sp. S3-1-1]
MEDERKKIIINEIKHWRAHQLLPQQYCDFLLALYTEGQEEEENKKQKTPYYLFFYFLDTLLLLLPIVLFLLTENVFMQITGIVITLVIAFSMIKFFSGHPVLRASYAVMIFFSIFLFATTFWFNHSIGMTWITFLWVLINSVSWIAFGKLKKQFFLQAGGVFVLIALIIMVGFNYF